MTKQEYMAMSLPYDLEVINEKGVRKTYAAVHYSYEFEPDFEKFTPILRPLSDLIKPISQANYNNGEPFVPALELVKLKEKYNKWKDIAPTLPYKIEIINKPFGRALKVSKLDEWVVFFSLEEIERVELFIISQLIKWHFDLFGGIESGEAIDVNSLDINPYK